MKIHEYTEVVLQDVPSEGKLIQATAGLYRGCRFGIVYGIPYGTYDVTVNLPPSIESQEGRTVFPELIPGTDIPIGTFYEAVDAAMCEIDKHFTIN